MQKKYKLQYLPLFWADFEGAVSYISDVWNNPEAAARLVDRTEEAILKRLKAPMMEQKYESTKRRELPYYWFAVGNFMVFYVVFGDIMEVRRFIFGARNLERLLP